MNTRGKQVLDRLAFVEAHLGRNDLDLDLADWYRTGETIADALAEAMHGDRDPRELDEGFVRQWQKAGRDLEREALQGKA